ncbi:MAG: thioredoxin-dependent thiol peroxidase [Rikenellaceae bacterium]
MEDIKVGVKAPLFKLMDAQGVEHSIEDYKKVILYFYPKDSTPGCTAEACSLRDGYSDIKHLGFEIIGISGDNAASHSRFIEKQNLPFILLSDEDKSVCAAYGAYGEKKFMGKTYMGIIRKTFVIEDGIITHIFDKVNTKTHNEQILEIL